MNTEKTEADYSSLAQRETVASSTALRDLISLFAGLFMLALGLGLQALANYNPQLVERYYSQGLYPFIARSLSFVNQWSRFSLAELLLLWLLLGALWWLVRQVRRVIRREITVRDRLLSLGLRLLLIAGGGTLLFLLLWGLNYQRLPLHRSLALTDRAPETEEILVITRAIVDGINQNYEAAAKDQNWTDHSRLPYDRARLSALIEAAYQKDMLLPSGISRLSGPAKPVMFSSLMSWFGISGVFNPFTGEPNYNTAQPDCDLPFVIAHEKAHQRGFAHESEANFAAFLICVNADDPYVRYSGYLHALSVVRAFGRLHGDVVPAERYRAIISQLGQGPRADLAFINSFWQRYQGRLMQTGQQVNDRYLKANRVAGGVASYNQADNLIIQYYLKYPP